MRELNLSELKVGDYFISESRLSHVIDKRGDIVEFYVKNGGWEGHFNLANNKMTIHGTGEERDVDSQRAYLVMRPNLKEIESLKDLIEELEERAGKAKARLKAIKEAPGNDVWKYAMIKFRGVED